MYQALAGEHLMRMTEPVRDRVRASTYRFRKPTAQEAADRLQLVCGVAGLDADGAVVSRITEITGGDPRASRVALNSLSAIEGRITVAEAKTVLADREAECKRDDE